MTTPKRTPIKTPAASPRPQALAEGDRVIVAGAGREWSGKIVSRRLPDGRESIHPVYDDTVIFVAFDETGVSMPVNVRQISRSPRR
jgi:hypothetical protein